MSTNREIDKEDVCVILQAFSQPGGFGIMRYHIIGKVVFFFPRETDLIEVMGNNCI